MVWNTLGRTGSLPYLAAENGAREPFSNLPRLYVGLGPCNTITSFTHVETCTLFIREEKKYSRDPVGSAHREVEDLHSSHVNAGNPLYCNPVCARWTQDTSAMVVHEDKREDESICHPSTASGLSKRSVLLVRVPSWSRRELLLWSHCCCYSIALCILWGKSRYATSCRVVYFINLLSRLPWNETYLTVSLIYSYYLLKFNYFRS